MLQKQEKSKRVPELGGRELTDLSPDVLTAYTKAGPSQGHLSDVNTRKTTNTLARLFSLIQILGGLALLLPWLTLLQEKRGIPYLSSRP